MTVTTIFSIVIFLCLVLAGGFALLWLRGRNNQQKNQLSESLDQNQQLFSQSMRELQKELLSSSEERASRLRMELLQELQNNRQEMHHGLKTASEGLEKRVVHMDTRLDQKLNSLNEGVQQKLEKNIKEGFQHFTKVQEHLSEAGKQLQNLNEVGSSINELNSLLKLPHLRGNFGEASLERLLSDMLPASAFELQYSITPNSTERVDAIIRYPKQVLPVDSKFPREQVLPLFETSEPAKLELARKNLADVIKTQAKQIAQKYIKPEYGTTDMALLFVPSETLYFEIIRNVKLCETLAKLKVFTVSPNTLAVSLHSISIAREYYEMAQGVEQTIAEVKKAQKHFENFDRRFGEVGKSLKKAQDAFETAGTHLGRYESSVNRLSNKEEELKLPETTNTFQEGNA